MPDPLHALAASYDDVRHALAEYQAIEAGRRPVASAHDFDADVRAADANGATR